MRDCFTFFRSFMEGVKDLDDHTYRKLIDAIMYYALDGIEPNLSGLENAVFQGWKANVDSSNKRRDNGAKGGKSKDSDDQVKQVEDSLKQVADGLKQNADSLNRNANGLKQYKKEKEDKGEDNRKDESDREGKENEKGDIEGYNPPLTPHSGDAPTMKKPKHTIKEQNTALFDKLIPSYSMTQELTDKARDWITYKGERKEPYTEQGMKSLLTQIATNEREYGTEAVISVINESMSNTYKGIVWERLKRSGNPPRASGSAYLDRIDHRLDIVDDWLKGEGDDKSGVFVTGKGDEDLFHGSEVYS